MWALQIKTAIQTHYRRLKCKPRGSQRDEDLWARGAVMAVKYVRSTKIKFKVPLFSSFTK